MTKLLFFCKRFPLVLDLGGLVLPLLADDLGDLWVGKTRILSDDLGLMVLTVQNESYEKSVPELMQIVWVRFFPTITRSRDLGIRLADTDVRGRVATARAGVHWRCTCTI